MKERNDTIRIVLKPGEGPLGALHGAPIKDGIPYLHAVYINDMFIWGDGVSISDFEDMLKTPGDYWPFFCSYCGVPECDDILYPVRCRHRGDQLVLIIRDPVQDTCVSCDEYGNCPLGEPESAYDCPKRSPRYHAYCIQKEQLRQQLSELRKQFGTDLDNC